MTTTSASTRKRRKKPLAHHKVVPGAVKERLTAAVEKAGTRNLRDEYDPRAEALTAELEKLGYAVDQAKGQRAVNFIERRCRHTKNPFYGVPFILHGFQYVIIFTFFACVRADGTRWFRRLWFEVAKKNGKALALNTPLPTPTGWTTMGEVRVGDWLFDESGHPCRVTFATEVMREHDCYRVAFSDGTSLVADGDHLWSVDVLSRHYRRETLSTREIATSLTRKSDGARNYRLPVAGPLECPEVALPVHPYVLGVWLGDGTSASAAVTCADSDVHILGRIASLGVPIVPQKRMPGRTGGYGFTGGDSCVQTQLRQLGVLRNKHIPALYLRGSVEQRQELLKGLMDTDGYVSAAGQCEFTTTSPQLRDGFLELARSLGYKPMLDTDIATLAGKPCGEKYRIQFRAWSDEPCFSLPRKQARLKARPEKATRSLHRHITSCEPVPSVPVRCIQVNSPSRLYRAGEGMVPTHNTELIAAILLYCLVGLEEYGGEIYSAASARDQARQTYKVMLSMVKQDPVLRKRVNYSNSRTARVMTCPQLEAVYEVMSADADYNDGVNPSACGVDEVHRHKSRDLYDVLAQGQGTRSEPVFIGITTAGAGQEGLAWEEHEHARQVIDGLTEDEELLAFIYSVPTEADWQDETLWGLANPAMGLFLREDDIKSAVAKAKTSATEEHNVRRLRLNQWVSTETKWLDIPTWDRNAGGPIFEDKLKGRPFYGGLDISHTQDFTAWALLFPWDDDGDGLGFDVLWRFWIPEKAVIARERKAAEIEAWAKAGWVTVTPGDIVDHRDLQRQVFRDCEQFVCQEIGYDNFHSYPVISEFVEQGLTLVDVSQGYRGMNAPAKFLETLLSKGRWHHAGNPVVRWMAGNAVAEYDRDDHVRPSRTKSQEKIDGLMAALSALERAMANAEDGDLSLWVPGEDTGTDG